MSCTTSRNGVRMKQGFRGWYSSPRKTFEEENLLYYVIYLVDIRKVPCMHTDGHTHTCTRVRSFTFFEFLVPVRSFGSLSY